MMAKTGTAEEVVDKVEIPAEVQAYIAALESKVAEQQAQVDALLEKNEGYLVWTPVKTFDGPTCSVTFVNGMAFLRKDRMFKDGGRDLTAEQMAQYLKADFGYDFEYFDRTRTDELNKRMTARARERADLEAVIGSRETVLEKMLEAHRM